MAHRKKTSGIQVIDRAMHVLEVVGDHPSISLTPLSAELKLALTTTKRIVDSLRAHNLIQQDPRGRGYSLGVRFQILAAQVPSQRQLVRTARPILTRLMHLLGEDVGLAVLQGTHALTIDRVLGPHPLKIIAPFSATVTLNCGYRRVLLAYQTEHWINEYLSTTQFIKYTEATVVRRDDICLLLAKLRAQGFVVSRGEHVPDAGGVAAPVFHIDGQLAATMFSYVPLARFSQAQASVHIDFVSAAAAELTTLLGGKTGALRRKARTAQSAPKNPAVAPSSSE